MYTEPMGPMVQRSRNADNDRQGIVRTFEEREKTWSLFPHTTPDGARRLSAPVTVEEN